MRDANFGPIRSEHPFAWLWEPLEAEATFVLRSMFGAKAAYLDGKIMLCFPMRGEEWKGVLVCTDRKDHASLMAEFPVLTPHSILSKWLFLPERAEHFERVAQKLVALAQRRDPRIGVLPQPKARRTKARKSKKAD